MTDLHFDYKEYREPLKDTATGMDLPKTLDWNAIRRLFRLDPAIVYLNSGTEGSIPMVIQKNYFRYIEKWASSPSYYFAFDKTFQDWQKSNRQKAGNFIGTPGENVCITGNTSEGLSMALLGADLREGDEILSTLHDYPSSESVCHVLSKSEGVIYTQLYLPSPAESKEEIVSVFRNAITRKTKVLLFSHINYTTGLRMPVKELCELATEKNLMTIIDGAHALGTLPLDMEGIGCDFYAAAGHKWLNGPPGTGILFIRDAERNPYSLLPILSELYGFETTYSISDMLQIRGCSNTPGFTAMIDAMTLNELIGKERILSRLLELNHYLQKRIIPEWGEACLLSPSSTPETRELCSGIVSFVPSRDPLKRFDKDFIAGISQRVIREYKIWIRDVSFLDKPSDGNKLTHVLRVSVNLFNDFDDIDKLILAIKAVSES
jgi:selenocysteine lyase/cysteine desulfurase